MLTDEERLKAMHLRAASLEKEKRKRQAVIAGAASVCVSFVLLIVLAVLFSRYSFLSIQEFYSPGTSASIFSNSGALGYMCIILAAFLLGVCVTVFCFMLKKWHDGTDK